MARPVALLKRLLAFLWSFVWSAWNFLASLNDNDWLAATSNEHRQERLFNTNVQSESLSLPWTIEINHLADDDSLEFTCAYNQTADSGLSEIQIDKIGVMRSVGVSDFYTGCLGNWPAFLRDCERRVAWLDWCESSSRVVSARLSSATAGQAYSPESYPLVAFAFGSYAWQQSAAAADVDSDVGSGGRSPNWLTRNFRCCLTAVLHLRLSPSQPASQIMRRFFLRWRPEQEESGGGEAAWQPRQLELRPYFSDGDGDNGGGGDGGGCVVCQSAPAGVLLLPCRHACVCAGCAARLPSDLCPLCRRLAHSRLALP